MNQCVCNHETGTNADGRKFCIGCGKYVESCRCRPIPEKVSIIIPVYNAEDYINEAIKNVLRQTYSNIEIIVVDDGSTDKTLVNLLRDPLAKNIKIIEKENGGVSSALNAGINAMTSNWFKWLSADDVMETNCIEVMMDKIKETPDKYNKILFNYHYFFFGVIYLLLVFHISNYT